MDTVPCESSSEASCSSSSCEPLGLEAHSRGFGEAAAHGGLQRFVPISEETVFPDSTEDKRVRLSQHSRVDVKVIDFAHTTFGRKQGSTVHHGPDSGFITGLDSLRRLLMEILSEV